MGGGADAVVSAPARPARQIELSADPTFSRRVRRLGLVSLVAPGLIWWLAATRLPVPPLLLAALFAGWWLMPAVLFASVPSPALRPLLIVPATLITVPVLAIVVWRLPDQPVAAFGWGLIAVGLLLGGVLGGWFWFRWAPVPAALHDPFSPARWGLIVVHVGCIILGFALAAWG
jgi:hypothetical protein